MIITKVIMFIKINPLELVLIQLLSMSCIGSSTAVVSVGGKI
jgi:hypothetical protein